MKKSILIGLVGIIILAVGIFFIQSCAKNEPGGTGSKALTTALHGHEKSGVTKDYYSHDTLTNTTYKMTITQYTDGTIDLARSTSAYTITTPTVVMSSEVNYNFDKTTKIVTISGPIDTTYKLYMIPFKTTETPQRAPVRVIYEVTCDCTGYGEGNCTPSTAYNYITCTAYLCSYCTRTIKVVNGGTKTPITGTSGNVFVYAKSIN